jgi:serine protease Do
MVDTQETVSRPPRAGVLSRRRTAYMAAFGLAMFGMGVGLVAHFDVGSRASAQEPPLWTDGARGGLDPNTPVTLTSFSRLAKQVSPAVVNISTSQTMRLPDNDPMHDFFFGPFGDMFEGPGGQPQQQGPGRRGFRLPGRRPGGREGGRVPKNRGLGTGFIINSKGFILTNNHVVEKADEIKVKLADERELPAKVVGRDAKTDLALLKVEAGGPLPVAPLGDSDRVEIGEWVVAIGNPFGLDHTVTAGIISAKGRRDITPNGRGGYYDFLQTDASINPGNSGGPLFNIRGEVIGINTAINAAGQGIGFAIPINMAKALVPLLKKHGRAPRSWMGVVIQPISPELRKSLKLPGRAGALIAEVVTDSPAEKAGIQPGDVITEFDGKAIHKSNDLPWIASMAGIGRRVNVTLLRKGATQRVTMLLGELPDETKLASAREGQGPVNPQGGAGALGLQVSPLSPEAAQEQRLRPGVGVLVTDVADGPAREAGIDRGDVILQVNDSWVKSLADFKRVTARLGKGENVRLLIRREGQNIWLAFTVR